MTECERNALTCEIGCLSVFRNILKKDTMTTFIKLLKDGLSDYEKACLAGEFVYSLAEYESCFSEFLQYAVFSDENKYIVNRAHGKEIADVQKKNVSRELELFTRLTSITPKDLYGDAADILYLPHFDNVYTDFSKLYEQRLKNISSFGYGIFSMGRMFRLEGNEIVKVKSADSVSEECFIGYEEERKKVFDNTEALVEGRPASNVLLFGDAGTGKSSTVKACVNLFYDKGVRLIELRKDQLFGLSDVMGKIEGNPLKFIIFIDDLSFNKNDDNFSMLKAALEGSASATSSNAVIYATSNRRHIVKESFSDRENADDIHHSDTVQELMSLSDRFGLTVYFERPNKALYLEIVNKLADKHDIKLDRQELNIKAEAFALNKGNRSPRAAEQFINSLLSSVQKGDF